MLIFLEYSEPRISELSDTACFLGYDRLLSKALSALDKLISWQSIFSSLSLPINI